MCASDNSKYYPKDMIEHHKLNRVYSKKGIEDRISSQSRILKCTSLVYLFLFLIFVLMSAANASSMYFICHGSLSMRSAMQYCHLIKFKSSTLFEKDDFPRQIHQNIININDGVSHKMASIYLLIKFRW